MESKSLIYLVTEYAANGELLGEKRDNLRISMDVCRFFRSLNPRETSE